VKRLTLLVCRGLTSCAGASAPDDQQAIARNSVHRAYCLATALSLSLLAAPPLRAAPPPARAAGKAVAQPSPSDEFLNAWVEVDSRFPLGMKLRSLIRSVQHQTTGAAWERTENGWILRSNYTEPLLRKPHNLVYRFVQLPRLDPTPGQIRGDARVLLDAAVDGETQYTDLALVKYVSTVFADLRGKDLPDQRVGCEQRVARAKSDTEAYIVDLRRKGKDVPF
jgi:hypothetical protein